MSFIQQNCNFNHNKCCENNKFWLEILEEHALFIKAGLLCNQTNLINKADKFAVLFNELKKTPCEIEDIVPVVKKFIRYQKNILKCMIACKLKTNISPTFLNFIIKEAKFFLTTLINPKCLDPYTASDLFAFWSEILKEHLEFTVYLIDITEKGLLLETHEFIKKYSAIEDSAKLYNSMIKSKPSSFKAFERAVDEGILVTVELAKFYSKLVLLSSNCSMLTTNANATLIFNHFLSETNKALEVGRQARSMGDLFLKD